MKRSRTMGRAAGLAVLLIGGMNLGWTQQLPEEDLEPAATDSVVVIFFDVAGTLTYRTLHKLPCTRRVILTGRGPVPHLSLTAPRSSEGQVWEQGLFS